MDKVREVIEGTYCDLCNIIKKAKRKKNGVVYFEDIADVENEPCKLSFETKQVAVRGNNSVHTVQEIKLFIAPEIQVAPGSVIRVAHMGKTVSYKRSGVPAVYRTHQEIKLELAEEYA